MQKTKHIVMLQSAHHHHDDRVYYHQARTLTEAGHQVEIHDYLSYTTFRPQGEDIYIVDTPLAMWQIRKTKAKIVYDITEWYPSKKNIQYLRFGKVCKSITLLVANLWAGCRADAFIFGESDKAAPFRFLFPKKPAIDLPYYPKLSYIASSPHRDIRKKCKLLYAGPLTHEKGFYRVMETATMLAEQFADTEWQLTIISADSYTIGSLPTNLEIEIMQLLPFTDFCSQLQHYDIFLDLRDIDIENTRCLPIKLFYYMAAGRPSIYSHLRAIEKSVASYRQCGELVSSSKEAAQAIAQYITHPDLYHSHCQQAHQLASTQYHWGMIQHRLNQFIDAL